MRSNPIPTPVVSALSAYDPGHNLVALRGRASPGGLIELGSNENAFGPSPAAVAAVRGCSTVELLRYPDPHGHALKRVIADHHHVGEEEVVLGNGSHELLMLLAQAYAGQGDEVLYSQFGFAVYAIAAASVGASGVVAPARPASDPVAPRGHDLEAFAAAITPRTRLIYLANPNNPTGTAFAVEAFAAFLACVPTDVVVVIDEAYVEYAADPRAASAMSIRARFPHLVVTRTFSKIHALAGLRIGYAIADASIVSTLDKLHETFNINTLANIAAIFSMRDSAHLEDCRTRNLKLRGALVSDVRALGLRVPDSQGNFVLIDFEGSGHQAANVEQSMLARGVVVRPMRGYGLPECLRVTVGTESEMTGFMDALRTALS